MSQNISKHREVEGGRSPAAGGGEDAPYGWGHPSRRPPAPPAQVSPAGGWGRGGRLPLRISQCHGDWRPGVLPGWASWRGCPHCPRARLAPPPPALAAGPGWCCRHLLPHQKPGPPGGPASGQGKNRVQGPPPQEPGLPRAHSPPHDWALPGQLPKLGQGRKWGAGVPGPSVAAGWLPIWPTLWAQRSGHRRPGPPPGPSGPSVTHYNCHHMDGGGDRLMTHPPAPSGKGQAAQLLASHLWGSGKPRLGIGSFPGGEVQGPLPLDPGLRADRGRALRQSQQGPGGWRVESGHRAAAHRRYGERVILGSLA